MSVACREAPAARFSEAFLLLTDDREALVELLEAYERSKDGRILDRAGRLAVLSCRPGPGLGGERIPGAQRRHGDRADGGESSGEQAGNGSAVALAEHAGAAAGEGLHPFHAPGYDALLDRIRDHEREAGKRMPAPLAQVLEEHEPLVRAEREAGKLAGRLDACLAKRGALLERAEQKLFYQQPVVELRWRYARWHREAERAQEAGHELLGNKRYADHLAALGGRATIERAVERIERAAVFDHLPARVVAACEILDDRVQETGRHRFFLPEHERACDLMSYSVQDGAAKAFVKNELAMREKMSDRARLLDKTKTLLEECQQERELAATDDLPFVRREDYGAWRLRAERAVDNANSILDDENKLAPFFKEEPGLRQTLAAWRPLDRTIWEEREDWERIERAEQERLEQRRDRSQRISM